MADDLYAADARAMIRERSLNADSVGKPANGERLANAAALNLNDGTLKVLETLARALDNLYINAYRITDFELGKVGTKLLFFELTNDFLFLLSLQTFLLHSNSGPPVVRWVL